MYVHTCERGQSQHSEVQIKGTVQHHLLVSAGQPESRIAWCMQISFKAVQAHTNGHKVFMGTHILP